MIILDHDTASIVLVIRGTFSIKDVVMDVVCEDSEFLDGFAHSGFLNGSSGSQFGSVFIAFANSSPFFLKNATKASAMV